MMGNKFIVIIRPEFMEFCHDACRSASLNHILFRIAGKAKDEPKEEIQAGNVQWYAKGEQITEEMANAWGVCKVNKEVNALVEMGLVGRGSNQKWKVDRTKHFFFGTEQCEKFLQLCEEHHICFIHLELPPEVKHLIYSSNANDKSIKCICDIHQMQAMDLSNAFDTSIETIPIDILHKINNKEDTYISPNVVETPTPVVSATAHADESRAPVSLFPVEQPAISSEQKPEQSQQVAPVPTSSKKEPRKKRGVTQASTSLLDTLDIEMKARVMRVYEAFDALKRETMDNPHVRYGRTDESTRYIQELIENESPNEEGLRHVYLKMWNMPKDTKSGFFWQEHMDIKNVCKQYPKLVMTMPKKKASVVESGKVINADGTVKYTAPAVELGGYRTFVPDPDDDEELNYLIRPNRPTRPTLKQTVANADGAGNTTPTILSKQVQVWKR